ncbi:MAG: DUF3014 domain-containing protein [Acidimicrobiia bacterium]|nr:DUF3014 domain-containing protein [Acidimicrobiia bacterium]
MVTYSLYPRCWPTRPFSSSKPLTTVVMPTSWPIEAPSCERGHDERGQGAGRTPVPWRPSHAPRPGWTRSRHRRPETRHGRWDAPIPGYGPSRLLWRVVGSAAHVPQRRSRREPPPRSPSLTIKYLLLGCLVVVGAFAFSKRDYVFDAFDWGTNEPGIPVHAFDAVARAQELQRPVAAIEALQPAQRQLLRMGPDNQRIVQAKLREIDAAIKQGNTP